MSDNAAQFMFQAFHHGFAKLRTVTLAGAVVGGLAQAAGRIVAVLIEQRWHDDTKLRPPIV